MGTLDPLIYCKKHPKSFLTHIIFIHLKVLEIYIFENSGKGRCRKIPDGQHWEFWKRAALNTLNIISGVSKTIDINDHFDKNTEKQHGGISIKSVRS